MVGLPKQFKKIAKKLDIRVHPDPELAKKFDKGCGRRYVNVGLNMIAFFQGVADKVNDDELKKHAKKIEDAVYIRDGDVFEKHTKLYKERLGDLGLWRTTEGISAYEKMKALNKLRKIGKAVKQQQDKEKEEKKHSAEHKEKKEQPYRDRGDY